MDAKSKGSTSATSSTSKKGYSSSCKRLCCASCCGTFVIIILGGAFWLFSAFEEPFIGVTDTTITTFDIYRNAQGEPVAVDLTMAFTVQVLNPSRRPIEFDLKGINSKVYSLDGAAPNHVGCLELISDSDAQLNDDVSIPAESETKIVMYTSTTWETGNNREIATRIAHDCVSSAGTKQTRMRVQIMAATSARVHIAADISPWQHQTLMRVQLADPSAGDHVRLDNATYDFDVPCHVATTTTKTTKDLVPS
jgi:hypothetical protein